MTYFLSDTLHCLEVADDKFYPSARDLPDPIGEADTKGRKKGGGEKGNQTFGQLSEHDNGNVFECKLSRASNESQNRQEAGDYKAASRSPQPQTPYTVPSHPCDLSPHKTYTPPRKHKRQTTTTRNANRQTPANTHQLDAPNIPDQPILLGLVELPDDGRVLFVLSVGLGVCEGCGSGVGWVLGGGEENEGEKGGSAFDRKISGNVEPDNQEERVDTVKSDTKLSFDGNRSHLTAGCSKMGISLVSSSYGAVSSRPRQENPSRPSDGQRTQRITAHRPVEEMLGIFPIQLKG